MVREDLKAAKIPEIKNGETRDFHSFRHAFGTSLQMAGAPQVLAQKMLRHNSSDMTQRYFRKPDGAKHAAVYRLAVPDGKYHNHALRAWLSKNRSGWTLEVVSRPPGAKGFVRLPRRWVVERTFAWNRRARRHSKDNERRTDSSEAMIKRTALHGMLRRLAPSENFPAFAYRSSAPSTFCRRLKAGQGRS